MIYAALYFYLAGVFPAMHIASESPGGMHIGKLAFAIFWPLICPPIYVLAIYKAVRP